MGVMTSGVIYQPEDIIVGGAGLLLGGHVLGEVGDGVAGGLEDWRRRRHSACGLRPDAGGVIHKVDVKAGFFDLLDGEVAGELVDDGADHLQMRQLLGTDIIEQAGDPAVGHGELLRKDSAGWRPVRHPARRTTTG